MQHCILWEVQGPSGKAAEYLSGPGSRWHTSDQFSYIAFVDTDVRFLSRWAYGRGMGPRSVAEVDPMKNRRTGREREQETCTMRDKDT